MKKIINGKRYDTETATKVADDSYSNYGDFGYWSEEIYRTQKGNWFLRGEGGDETRDGSVIIPFTKKEALAWLEAHTSDSEAYKEYFADVVEDA